MKRYDTPPRSQPGDLRATIQWQTLARQQLRDHPLCQSVWCARQAPRVTAARDAHHIAPLAVAPELAYDASNLASLCQPCHAKITGLERRLLARATNKPEHLPRTLSLLRQCIALPLTQGGEGFLKGTIPTYQNGGSPHTRRPKLRLI